MPAMEPGKSWFGEPWRADETAVEGNALLADKAHIHLLDEQVGMFSDDTRDAIKGSVFEQKNRDLQMEERSGRADTGLCESLVRTKGAESESTIPGDHVCVCP